MSMNQFIPVLFLFLSISCNQAEDKKSVKSPNLKEITKTAFGQIVKDAKFNCETEEFPHEEALELKKISMNRPLSIRL